MDSKLISSWGSVVVSVIAMLTFVGALIASFWIKDANLLSIAVGAAIANATTVVQFFLGSSAGSQKKDEVIAVQNGKI